jgi:hypothetical protein
MPNPLAKSELLGTYLIYLYSITPAFASIEAPYFNLYSNLPGCCSLLTACFKSCYRGSFSYPTLPLFFLFKRYLPEDLTNSHVQKSPATFPSSCASVFRRPLFFHLPAIKTKMKHICLSPTVHNSQSSNPIQPSHPKMNNLVNKRSRTRLLLSLLAISSTESFLSQHQAPVSNSIIPALHLAAYRNDDTFSSSPPTILNKQPFLSTKPPSSLPNGGSITLLGAGPGDPDLLTVKAYRLLSDEKNLVIVDRLVSEEILALVKGEVKRANKYPGCAEQVCFSYCCGAVFSFYYC